MIKAVLLVFFFIIPYNICRKCISCTHDPKTAQNFDCVGGNSTAGNYTGEITEDVAGKYSFECTEEGGTEYCFTLVTSEPDWSSGGAFPSKIEDMVFIFEHISIVIICLLSKTSEMESFFTNNLSYRAGVLVLTFNSSF